MHIEAENMDDIQRLALQHIFEKGHIVQPRGIRVQEITGVSFKLLQPRARFIYNPSRVYNITFAIGELLWYLRGSDQLDIISFYNTRYSAFSDDGVLLYGAYGKRLFTSDLTGFVQWDALLTLLQADKDTRQAVLQFHFPSDLQAVSRDIPCTCTMQFLIRENKLECVVMMRSNDIIWGTAYDVFSFTMIQEILAKQLGLQLGTYTHFVGSLHLYEWHRALAEAILDEPAYAVHIMPEMPDTPWQGIHDLLKTEEQLRVWGLDAPNLSRTWPTHPYWMDFAHVLEGHAAWRAHNEQHLARVSEMLPPPYAPLLARQVRRPSHVYAGSQPPSMKRKSVKEN